MRLILTVSCLLASLASTASAAVVYFPGQEIPIPTTFAGVSVNLETAAVTNALAGAPGADANFVLGGAGITNDADQTASSPSWQAVRSAATNSADIINLSLGTLVDGSSVTGNDFGASGGTVTHFATFVSGTPGHIGFEVLLADSTVAYGWMRVTVQDDNTPGVIHEWAFENTGAPIMVGQIPEPSQALLSMVGLTLLMLRRRR